MQSFLNDVAKYFHSEREWEMSRTTFVFPNQRSAMFFEAKIKALMHGNEELAPTMFITMAELMEKAAGLRRATAMQRLVWLYVAYCRVRKRNPNADGSESIPEDFDRFRFWGEMLLKDFDEMDRYLADHRQLFKNVRDFKSIQSNYLTPEQLEIIKTYWGEDPYWGHLDAVVEGDESDGSFWRHLSGPDGVTGRFALLWELLSEVYDEFHSILVGHDRKCYPGMAFRIVANKVRKGDLADFPMDKYAFIGFSDLSPSELVVMDALRKRGQALFFWDYDPDLMGAGGSIMAGRFVGKYIREFPAPSEFVHMYPQNREIRIVSSPSNTGQCALAMPLLTDESALVLLSEDLLLPVLSMFPAERLGGMSISMGYPLRQTDMATLFAAVVGMQLRLVRRSDGSYEFFRDDVMAILLHPLIRSNFPAECQAVVDHMANNFLFNLPVKDVAGSEFEALAPVFTPVVDRDDPDAVTDYTDRLLIFMEELISKEFGRELDLKVCSFLRKQNDELRNLIKSNPEVGMRKHTYFHLIENAMFRNPIRISGKHTTGLQILGMLETRSLSFNNVVVLSMSDRVFPGKRAAKSFIPSTLRRGFGMPTYDVAEANMAYNFYRLISHANTSTLIFDSRTGGLRSGDMSRFLYQLRFLQFKGVTVKYLSGNFGPVSLQMSELPANKNVGVVKDESVMAALNRYRNPDMLKDFAISASSFKKYINCPLSFYFEYVADLKVPDPQTEDVDSATLGSVFHGVAERVYSYMRDSGMNPITFDKLMQVMDSEIGTRELQRAVNKYKVKIPETIIGPDGTKIENPELYTRELSRLDQMLAKTVREMIEVMAEYEPQELTFIDAEFSRRFLWTPLESRIAPFNFTMSIDRIDSIPSPDGSRTLRLIDYKTGTDKTGFNDVNSLFTESSDKHLGGIFQLMLYSCAYADLKNDHESAMRPIIYLIRDLANPNKRILKFGSNPQNRSALYDYHQIEDDFRKAFADKINELFNPQVPFYRCDGSAEGSCRYCKFKNFCGVI